MILNHHAPEIKIAKRIVTFVLCVILLFSVCNEFLNYVGATTYYNVYRWGLRKNDGSYNEEFNLDSFNNGGKPYFTWIELKDFDDSNYEAYAEELAQSLKTDFTFYFYDYSFSGAQTAAIVGVRYTIEQAKDPTMTKRWCLTFHLDLDPQHTLNWGNGHGVADVNIRAFGAEGDPDPPVTYTQVTRWRLTRTNGSYVESGDAEGTIRLTDRTIDFESEDAAREYAAQLRQEFTQIRLQTMWWIWADSNLKILDIEFDYISNRGALYKITIADTIYWHTDKGGGLASLSVLVPNSSKPTERRGVRGWRLVRKDTSIAVVVGYNNVGIQVLPDIADVSFEEYAATLLELYDFQVSFNESNSDSDYTTYPLKSFVHRGDGIYLLVPEDAFYWAWNDELIARVRVRENDDPLSFKDCTNWGVVGGGLTEIYNTLKIGWAAYDDEVENQEEDFAAELKKLYPYLTVQQGDSWISSVITEITYDKEASDDYNGSGIRKNAVYKITVKDHFYGAGGTEAEFYIIITGEGDFGPLDIITIKAKDPDGIRMNLFDYWINSDDRYDESGNPWDPNNWSIYDGGINRFHALKFFNMGYSTPDSDHRNQIGWWNHGTENREKNVTGIVRPTLLNRYPQLNLGDTFYPATTDNTYIRTGVGDKKYTEESLAYLFDPTYTHDGKASYANVTGLFQRNDNGYYYYDSKLNFAQYDKLYNTFLLYNTWGVTRNSDASPNGQFFPFASLDLVFNSKTDDETGETTLTRSSVQSREYALNHFFGFTMEIDFQQPKGGIVNLGDQEENMVFQFSGDDDVWVFVDGVLVLDLGGVHSGIYGEINFATGEVTTGFMDTNAPGAAGWVDGRWPNPTTTLQKIFADAKIGYGMENDIYDWDNGTFETDTLHTLKVFYLERGHFDSNFAMYFNLQARVPHKIYKVDEDGAPVAGANFAIYAATPSNDYKNGETYHSANEFVPVDLNGNEVSWDEAEPLNAELVTGADGYVTLGGIDFATRAKKEKIYYFLEETSSPSGYRVLPERLVLQFMPDEDYPQRGVFKVLNQYETGAYASFSAILQDDDDDMYYATASVDPATGKITILQAKDEDNNNQVIKASHQSSAMLFAVPMIYANIGAGQRWYPIYGSNTNGYHVVDIYKDDEYYTHDDNKANGYDATTYDGVQAAFRWALRHNLLAAAMRQVADVSAPDWYFRYESPVNASGEIMYSRFTAELYNLPGDKDRYLVNNNQTGIDVADLRLVGLLVDADAIVALIDQNGGSIDLEEFKALKDEEKYVLLQDTLKDKNFETEWDTQYNATTPNWDDIRGILDDAYVQSTDGTSRERGVNLAYIDEFTRYYGSVFYIPNERRELRVLKQDSQGNPLAGATFALYASFQAAANGGMPIVTGTTGSNGILIFGSEEDKSPANKGSGFAEMNWDGYTGTLWLKELSAPKGYVVNDAIVQIYVGERTIYANASAFKANNQKQPEMIDDPESAESTDGVTVLASVGKLFQSMEKFADPLLNSTLLDIDGRTFFYRPGSDKNTPDNASLWKPETDTPTLHLHFWDRRELGYTSSDYSTAHKKSADGTIGGEAFVEAQHGYLQLHPTQTPTDLFRSQHSGVGELGTRDSRREELFDSDGNAIDLYNIFSPMNIVVVRDELEGDADLRITKVVKGDAPEADTLSKQYTFHITGPAEAAGNTYTVEGAVETEVTFTEDAASGGAIATVTVVGAGTVTLEKLPLGTYTVVEDEDGAQIGGYLLKVTYSPKDGQVTVQEGIISVIAVTNTYSKQSGQDCKLTITDGGHVGTEDCGEKNEIFLYKVTGETSDGKKIELLVSVEGGGSTTISVPPGAYVVEELPTWSWKYKNILTEGREGEEWTISDDWITSSTSLHAGEWKEVIYHHARSDTNWPGGESHADNRFAGVANSN